MDVKTLCLGALQMGDASGYEIKKQFEDGLLSHICEVSFGAIYPALAALERDGLAVGTAMAQDKRPDKKVYSLTESGRRALVAALMRPLAADRYRSDFVFVMVLGELLPREHLEKLVEQHLAFHREMQAYIEGCMPPVASPSHRLVHGLGVAVHRAAAEYLERHKHALREAAPEAVAVG